MAFPSTGRLRVFQVGEDGREVTLYWIERHECCVPTVACRLGGVLRRIEDGTFRRVDARMVGALLRRA